MLHGTICRYFHYTMLIDLDFNAFSCIFIFRISFFHFYHRQGICMRISLFPTFLGIFRFLLKCQNCSRLLPSPFKSPDLALKKVMRIDFLIDQFISTANIISN